jgi:hypothetical protein
MWPVEADGPELESAILNLAVNARDAMPNGGKMTIEASNSYLDEVYCSQHAEAPGSIARLLICKSSEPVSSITPTHRPWPPPTSIARDARDYALRLSSDEER